MKLTYSTLTYPNGSQYIAIKYGDRCVFGHISIVYGFNGGYLASGKRKPVATIQEAAKQIIESKIKSLQKDIDGFKEALAEVKNIERME